MNESQRFAFISTLIQVSISLMQTSKRLFGAVISTQQSPTMFGACNVQSPACEKTANSRVKGRIAQIFVVQGQDFMVGEFEIGRSRKQPELVHRLPDCER